jgi:hypothetical protein
VPRIRALVVGGAVNLGAGLFFLELTTFLSSILWDVMVGNMRVAHGGGAKVLRALNRPFAYWMTQVWFLTFVLFALAGVVAGLIAFELVKRQVRTSRALAVLCVPPLVIGAGGLAASLSVFMFARPDVVRWIPPIAMYPVLGDDVVRYALVADVLHGVLAIASAGAAAIVTLSAVDQKRRERLA